MKLRGWRRGRFLQRLRAAGARFGRECGPVHQAAAARPGPTIRLEEQTRIRRRSVYPAPACDAADRAVFRLRRSLRLVGARRGSRLPCDRPGRVFTDPWARVSGARGVALVQAGPTALNRADRGARRSSPAPRDLVSDHALRPHQPLMQGLEHIEDLPVGFILALFDGFGDKFIEWRLPQLAFLQKLIK